MDSFPGAPGGYGAGRAGAVVRFARFRADLSLLREGVDVAVGFGVRSLEGLGGVAEFLEHAVYEPRSFRAIDQGVTFTLRNPPLRMGAFGSIRVGVDGVWTPPSQVSVHPGDAPAPIPLDQVDRDRPVTLPIGLRTAFVLRGVDPTPRRARVRLELLSVAIPPLVWYEFEDELRAASSAP